MNLQNGFAVWITGVPASGKSTIAGLVAQKLRAAGIPVMVLESDAMRTILTPRATYSPEERDRFYHALVLIGDAVARNGISVIFDATGNRRAYRDHARSLIGRFVEVYIRCPLDVCRKRDPKGIYGRAAAGETSTLPGVQAPYEEPPNPEIILNGTEDPDSNAGSILEKLKQLLYI